MILKELKPRKALNKAFLKVKPNRTEIEGFKTNLITLLDRTNDTESEEFHKNLVSDFLKDTYYKQNHFINTKGRNDLVIHNGQNANSTVGVILEAKKPTNKAEMISTKKLNAKAFQELVLYYLRERITHQNLEVKHLVATNINEWFIFDATLFDRLFAQNKNLVKQFNDFEGGRLADTKTDFFYKQIAEPFIDSITSEIEFTYFNIQDFQKPLRNSDKADDNSLIALFKLLSPEHLLKLPFTNDSNSLDKRFYSELLHIIGLTETKEGSKKLIERNKAGERHTGTILEDAIIQLDSLDKLSRLEKPNQFGNTQQERLFNVALELSITWINRILFLKLLEAQLITYHKGDKSYSFLNFDKIKNYDDLNSLFFQVLARKYDERNEDVKKAFEKVPYLNSSLFEPSDIEHQAFPISSLREKEIPIFSQTVLKDQQGKKRTGDISTLQYLFEFLDAYDFGAEGGEEIQEDNKTLINASVLGLIFEKINGYKDGSFFTPGFITMYMCRETIRKAVVQKFNEYSLNHDLLDDRINVINDVYELIPQKISRKKANEIINSIKICDPAVGSGHFLVSALNEMIAVKNDLKILEDSEGKSLHRYEVEVVNDELIVTDEEGELFEYNPSNKESQRIQETLFHEKQTIIENSLFGVDINSNSVKICRLRLWIELLKNAYYKNATELETLPNIDINIKCGNSLVSRFAIDADLKQALKKSKWTIDSYRVAVDTYRNAESKEQKREMERLIADIKSDFRSEIEKPFIKKLSDARGKAEILATELLNLKTFGQKIDKALLRKHEMAVSALSKLEAERDEIKANKIFENAFEWRFEFPEVLNDDGDFVGFDVVIGNPPYIGGREWNLSEYEFNYYLNKFTSAEYQFDAYVLFWDLSIMLSKYLICLITPNTWLNNQKNKNLRINLLQQNLIEIADYSKIKVFEDATVLPIITLISKGNNLTINTRILEPSKSNEKELLVVNKIDKDVWANDDLRIFNIDLKLTDIALRSKIEQNSHTLDRISVIKFGIKIYETGKGLPPQSKDDSKNKIYEANSKLDLTYRRYLEGKDINTYQLNWKNKWLKYGQNLAAPRDPVLFEGERLLIRRIVGERLISTYTKEDFVTSQLLQIVKPFNPKQCKVILAILNSRLIAYYFRKKYNRQDITFPEIRIYELSSLPIKLPINTEYFDIIVDQILKLKQQNLKSDTSDLENQIDHLVYQLYELTEEEIKIVEGV